MTLVWRETLALFGHVYEFIRRCYSRRQPLFLGVRRELRWAVALAPLPFRGCRPPAKGAAPTRPAQTWGLVAAATASSVAPQLPSTQGGLRRDHG